MRPNASLAFAITLQPMQSVAWRDREVVKACREVHVPYPLVHGRLARTFLPLSSDESADRCCTCATGG